MHRKSGPSRFNQITPNAPHLDDFPFSSLYLNRGPMTTLVRHF